jgi:hypothetical protein
VLYIPYSALKVTFQGFSTTVPVNLYESGEHRAAQFPAKLSGKRWKSLAGVCDRVCFRVAGHFSRTFYTGVAPSFRALVMYQQWSRRWGVSPPRG